MSGQLIPNTNDKEVAIMAIALEFVVRDITEGTTTLKDLLEKFDTAYKGISQTVSENAATAKPMSADKARSASIQTLR